MTGSLDTTNLLLGIMAAVSVLEGLVLLAVLFAGWKLYFAATQAHTSLMERLQEIEARHVAPMAARVNDILDDVKSVSGTIKDEAQRVDRTINRTIDRADHTAQWVRSAVVNRTSRVVGAVRGVVVALETLLANGRAEYQDRT